MGTLVIPGYAQPKRYCLLVENFYVHLQIKNKLHFQHLDYFQEKLSTCRGKEYVTTCRGNRYEWRSSDSALGYFISKIISQQHKIVDKESNFIIFDD